MLCGGARRGCAARQVCRTLLGCGDSEQPSRRQEARRNTDAAPTKASMLRSRASFRFSLFVRCCPSLWAVLFCPALLCSALLPAASLPRGPRWTAARVLLLARSGERRVGCGSACAAAASAAWSTRCLNSVLLARALRPLLCSSRPALCGRWKQKGGTGREGERRVRATRLRSSAHLPFAAAHVCFVAFSRSAPPHSPLPQTAQPPWRTPIHRTIHRQTNDAIAGMRVHDG
jgi:hypothetical protein